MHVSHDRLLLAILLSVAIAGAVGYWYGMDTGKARGYRNSQADVLNDQARQIIKEIIPAHPDATTTEFTEPLQQVPGQRLYIPPELQDTTATATSSTSTPIE